MVFSTKVKVCMKALLELSQQFVQRELSGFNMEQNLDDSTSEELHPFSTVKLQD
jgi:hypothetical protein